MSLFSGAVDNPGAQFLISVLEKMMGDWNLLSSFIQASGHVLPPLFCGAAAVEEVAA